MVLCIRNVQILRFRSIDRWELQNRWPQPQIRHPQSPTNRSRIDNAPRLPYLTALIGHKSHHHGHLRHPRGLIGLIVDNRTGPIHQHNIKPPNPIPRNPKLPCKHRFHPTPEIILLDTMFRRVDIIDRRVGAIQFEGVMVLEIAELSRQKRWEREVIFAEMAVVGRHVVDGEDWGQQEEEDREHVRIYSVLQMLIYTQFPIPSQYYLIFPQNDAASTPLSPNPVHLVHLGPTPQRIPGLSLKNPHFVHRSGRTRENAIKNEERRIHEET